MIEITEVRVSLRNDEKLKAFVSITLNPAFVIRGLKIIRGNTGLFVAMPSRKRPDGQHQDLAHPIHDATRKYLTQTVLPEYERERTRSVTEIRFRWWGVAKRQGTRRWISHPEVRILPPRPFPGGGSGEHAGSRRATTAARHERSARRRPAEVVALVPGNGRSTP